MCHICYKQFGDSKKGPKVCDHCHYTGRHREPVHRNCNLMYRILSYIPVVFHNLSGYDALFIRELGRHSRDTIGVIAKNKEDYNSFSVDITVNRYVDKLGNEKEKLIKLRFIDSFKFMASSLDSLTRNLVGTCARPAVVVKEEKSWLDSRIIRSYNTSYLPEKGFTHMNICCPGIYSRIPNSLI